MSKSPHAIPQHQLLGVRMQVDMLVHPLGHRVAAQMMFEQGRRHDQRHQPLPVVLDEAQKLLLVVARQVIPGGESFSGNHPYLLDR